MPRPDPTPAARPSVIVFGGGGMLGHVLAHRLAPTCDVVVTSRAPLPANALPPSVEREVGLVAEDLASVRAVLQRRRPAVVLNAIGVTKQRELDPLTAITVNALFPHQLARAAGEVGARLVHFSSDCVFSGRHGNYRASDPPDPPDPIDLYGRTKLLGEVGAPGCLTLRSSFIGPELTGKRGLFEWLRAQGGHRVTGYQRAIFSGLTTTAMADVVARVVSDHPQLEGVWQVAGPRIDKHALLVLLRDAFALDVTIVGAPEPRIDRSLDGGAFLARTGLAVPDWPTMIDSLRRFAYDRANLYGMRPGDFT